MKFQRGKDPKEATRIGRAGNAIQIHSLKIVSPYKGKDTLQHAYYVNGEQAIGILKSSEHSPPQLRTDVESGIYDIFVVCDLDNGRERDIPLEDLKGEYVEYQEEIYPILFPLEITMNIKLGKDGFEI